MGLWLNAEDMAEALVKVVLRIDCSVVHKHSI